MVAAVALKDSRTRKINVKYREKPQFFRNQDMEEKIGIDKNKTSRKNLEDYN